LIWLLMFAMRPAASVSGSEGSDPISDASRRRCDQSAAATAASANLGRDAARAPWDPEPDPLVPAALVVVAEIE
jgi:hypothetical protein